MIRRAAARIPLPTVPGALSQSRPQPRGVPAARMRNARTYVVDSMNSSRIARALRPSSVWMPSEIEFGGGLARSPWEPLLAAVLTAGYVLKRPRTFPWTFQPREVRHGLVGLPRTRAPTTVAMRGLPLADIAYGASGTRASTIGPLNHLTLRDSASCGGLRLGPGAARPSTSSSKRGTQTQLTQAPRATTSGLLPSARGTPQGLATADARASVAASAANNHLVPGAARALVVFEAPLRPSVAAV